MPLKRIPTPDYHAHDDRDWQAWELITGDQTFYVETVNDAGWKIGYMAATGPVDEKFSFWEQDYYGRYKDIVRDFLKLYRDQTGQACLPPKRPPN